MGPFCVHSCFPWGAFATHAGSNRMYGTFRTSNRRRDGTSHPWHAEIGKEGMALLLGSGPTSRVSLVLVQQPTSLPTVVGSYAAQTEKVFKVVKAGMQVLARVTVRGSPSMFRSHGLFSPYYVNLRATTVPRSRPRFSPQVTLTEEPTWARCPGNSSKGPWGRSSRDCTSFAAKTGQL